MAKRCSIKKGCSGPRADWWKRSLGVDWWFNSGEEEEQNYYIIPSDFSTEFPFQLWNEGGDEIFTDYDFEATKNAITGNTAYVDLEAGVNGSGTEGSPFNSISSAAAGSFNIFIVKGKGRLTNSALTVTKNIKILPWPGEDPPEFTREVDTPLSWSPDGTFPNVYGAANPSAPTFINNVLDRATLDANGLYTGLTRQTNITNCNANPGSFFYDSGTDTIYVRTSDSRPADADIVAIVGSGTVINVSGNVSSTKYVYAEGIKIFGGNQAFQITNAGSAYVQFGFVDCEFSHAAGTEASAYINGKARGFYKNCNSFYNRDDAFDYNASDCFVFEYYCKSGRNTWTGTAVNGSTSHNASKVIRVGGNYQFTAGKPVQDIENSRTYSLRCLAGNANAASPNDYAYASNSVTGTTHMWLIECQWTGPSGRSYVNFANAVMNIYDGAIGNLLTGSNQNSGTLNLLTEGDVYQ